MKIEKEILKQEDFKIRNQGMKKCHLQIMSKKNKKGETCH